MHAYKESAALEEFAKGYQEFEITRDLGDLEDLEVYIYSIKIRFIERENFVSQFVEGYELLRSHAEGQIKQTKKYSRENYIDSNDD